MALQPTPLNEAYFTPLLALFATLIIGTSTVSVAAAVETTANRPTAVMEEIVVSGSLPSDIRQIAQFVSLISADDIARSAARDLPSLLASEANITVKSFSSNAKHSSIDLRGAGDTAVSNILVLLDGVEINSGDLAGPNFSGISLEQIERIEILRGGNSVRYGSGASHGVIHIISREAQSGSRHRTQMTLTEYRDISLTQRSEFATNTQSIGISVAGTRSNGYRDNSQLDNHNSAIDYRWQPSDDFSLQLKSQHYRDHYGLPGPISHDHQPRTDSLPGARINGQSGDDRQSIKLSLRASEQLQLEAQLQRRQRRDDFIGAFDFDSRPADEHDMIRQHSSKRSLLLHWRDSHDALQLILGLEDSDSEQRRTQGGQNREAAKIHRADSDGRATFSHLGWQASEPLRLTLGYRRDRSAQQQRLDTLQQDTSAVSCEHFTQPFEFFRNCPLIAINDSAEKNYWRNEAYEGGLSYRANEDLTLYTSIARTFRNPNIDELAQADNNLGPQRAERYESGIKYAGQSIDIQLNLFKALSDEEILFRSDGTNTGLNFNYPHKLRRQGVEAEAHWPLNDHISLRGNIGYTDAEARDSDLRLPLVPFLTAAGQLDWQIDNHFGATFSLRYTGKRYDGNDFNNHSYPRLSSLSVAAVKLRYRQQPLQLFAGINNLFDKNYSDIAYSGGIYPAAKRHFFVGAAYVWQ